MDWLFLLCAGVCEVIGVAGFERFTRLRDALGLAITLAAFGLGLTCLHFAMDRIPMAVAYGVFTGIGTVGATLLGIAFWGDSARPLRLACIGAIAVAVIGIKFTL